MTLFAKLLTTKNLNQEIAFKAKVVKTEFFSHPIILIMKLLYILPLLILSFFVLGCASSSGTEAAASEEAAEPEASSDPMGTRTAYEGSTGSGLLMERYKSGQIEGYRE